MAHHFSKVAASIRAQNGSQHGRIASSPRGKLQKLPRMERVERFRLMTQSLLANRSLSRLLGKDWPKTLDELEALKRK